MGGEGYNGMVDCFTKIVKNEGFSRLYRGITAPILMEAPKRWVPARRSSDGPKRLTKHAELPNSQPMTPGVNTIGEYSACKK